MNQMANIKQLPTKTKIHEMGNRGNVGTDSALELDDLCEGTAPDEGVPLVAAGGGGEYPPGTGVMTIVSSGRVPGRGVYVSASGVNVTGGGEYTPASGIAECVSNGGV
jgi:hypothetical protein